MKKIYKVIMIFGLLFSFSIPVQASENTCTVVIPVEQTFSTSFLSVSNQFKYELCADSANNPMPEKSSSGIYSWYMQKNEKQNIVLHIKDVGDYSYKIHEIAENRQGYTYDTQTYTVWIHSYLNDADELQCYTIVKNNKGEKVDTVTFNNSYVPVKSTTKTKTNTGVNTLEMNYVVLLGISIIFLCFIVLIRKKGGAKHEKKN